MRNSIRKTALRRLGEEIEPNLLSALERERVAIFLLCAVLALLIVTEGLSALFGGPRLVAAWLVGLLVVVGYGVYHLRAVRNDLEGTRRGLARERAVYARLAGVAVLGARVFLRVPVEKGYLDVVIVSQHGVFAAALWVADARKNGPSKVVIDESRFRFEGSVVTPNPVRSAVEQVQALQHVVRIGRTDDVAVRPLVIVAGASVEVDRHAGAPDVPVVSIDALDAYLKAQPEQLALTEVTMHAVRLVAHIREHVPLRAP